MDLEISTQIIGRRVSVIGKPDWGIGVVRRVQTTTINGATQHRVSVQFNQGTKLLISPPARLTDPVDDPQRKEAGWIEQIGGGSLDSRLRQLPESAVQVLGTIQQRLDAVIPHYSRMEDGKDLIRWARRQTGVGDPLSQWSRDELEVAFASFCNERDAHLRNLCALLKKNGGDSALQEWLSQLDDDARPAVYTALRKPL